MSAWRSLEECEGQHQLNWQATKLRLQPDDMPYCAADRCGGRCGGAAQAGVQNACGHMYLDQGEEMNLTRSLNNYITMASQVVRQVWAHSHFL